jgi:hypothetical protein
MYGTKSAARHRDQDWSAPPSVPRTDKRARTRTVVHDGELRQRGKPAASTSNRRAAAAHIARAEHLVVAGESIHRPEPGAMSDS